MIDPGGSRDPPCPPQPRHPAGLDPGSASVAPLRGRGPEVAALGEVLDQAAAGRPALALVEGEAGSARPCCWRACSRRPRVRGMQVARGRAEELEQHRPFGLVAAAFGCKRSAADPRRARSRTCWPARWGSRSP